MNERSKRGFWPGKGRLRTLALVSCRSVTLAYLRHIFWKGITISSKVTMEWEQKADGMRVDEKIFRERWIEMILLRWYTYNRHGLYLWLDCFLTRARNVSFQYNTDIFFCFICSRSKRLFFSFFCLCFSLQMCCGLPMILPPPPPGHIQWHRKTALLTELTKKDLCHC